MKKQVKLKEYIFNWEGSAGWNSVWAKTKRGAIKQAKEEWKDHPNLNPNEETFRLATYEELQFLSSLFH